MQEHQRARGGQFAGDLERPRTQPALRVIARRELPHPRLYPLHSAYGLRCIQLRQQRSVAGSKRLDLDGVVALDQPAQLLRFRPIVGEHAVERNDSGGILDEFAADAVERALGRGDQQAQYQRGHRGDQTGREFHDTQ